MRGHFWSASLIFNTHLSTVICRSLQPCVHVLENVSLFPHVYVKVTQGVRQKKCVIEIIKSCWYHAFQKRTMLWTTVSNCTSLAFPIPLYPFIQSVDGNGCFQTASHRCVRDRGTNLLPDPSVSPLSVSCFFCSDITTCCSSSLS